jgi:2-polyprenyl-3-methyl-5-hydroxy-6-metoxy-1,4-benzoquinol methylase
VGNTASGSAAHSGFTEENKQKEIPMTVTATAVSATTTTDMDSLKSRLKATWMDGNYDYFSRFMQDGAAEFFERLNVSPAATLLDVACGSGQIALIAARKGIRATGCDIAANLVLAARGRAASEGLAAQFEEGDAEALPYADGSFDVVATMFGAMFAPRPELVASELVRVCRPGGMIAMANWTREGFIGQMFKTFAKFISPPGMPSPVLWGDETTVHERLGGSMSPLRLERVMFRFDYPFSPAEVVEFFRQNYGPTTRAFGSLDEAQQTELRSELTRLWSAHNTSAESGRTIVNAEYLQVTGTTRMASELHDSDDPAPVGAAVGISASKRSAAAVTTP